MEASELANGWCFLSGWTEETFEDAEEKADRDAGLFLKDGIVEKLHELAGHEESQGHHGRDLSKLIDESVSCVEPTYASLGFPEDLPDPFQIEIEPEITVKEIAPEFRFRVSGRNIGEGDRLEWGFNKG